jgi:ABC-2 type transport system permease protein
MLALTRKFDNGRTQRIVVSGDADWLSNREMNTIHSNIRTINSPMSQILFTWMSNDYVPLKMNRPDFEDKYVDFPYEHFKTLRMLLYFILPLVVLLGGLTICAIRKRK